MTIRTCIFDAYGTLYDVTAAARECAKDPGRVAKNTATPEIKKLEKEIAEMKPTLTVAKFTAEGLGKFMYRLKKKETMLTQLKSSDNGTGKDKTPS